MTTQQQAFRIGVDLGGTKIEIALLDGDGRFVLRERQATPAGDYAQTLCCVINMIKAVDDRFGQAFPVGIATPGALHDGRIKNSNSVCLNGKALQADIEAGLDRSVRISNDANCFVLSEAIDGAAQGNESVFGVIIGTGTGGGIVIQQQVLHGANAIAGEWGHNALPWVEPEDLPAQACYCGKSGCIETYLSGPGFAQRFNAATGGAYSAEHIIALAQQGDEAACLHLQAYQRRLAKSLAAVINILDPDVIVLGGGMSNIDSLYATVPVLWRDYVFSPTVRTQLVAPRHGDSSGVRGAAWLWPQAVSDSAVG